MESTKTVVEKIHEELTEGWFIKGIKDEVSHLNDQVSRLQDKLDNHSDQMESMKIAVEKMHRQLVEGQEGGERTKDVDPARRKLLSKLLVAAVRDGGNPWELRRLLAQGAEVDFAEDACGETALLHAAACGEVRAVLVLLEAGASITAVPKGRRTPLHAAAEAGHGGCVRALLAAGHPVDPVDAASKTPLQLAAQGGHEAAVRALLTADANPKLFFNYYGGFGYERTIQELLYHHANQRR